MRSMRKFLPLFVLVAFHLNTASARAETTQIGVEYTIFKCRENNCTPDTVFNDTVSIELNAQSDGSLRGSWQQSFAKDRVPFTGTVRIYKFNHGTNEAFYGIDQVIKVDQGESTSVVDVETLSSLYRWAFQGGWAQRGQWWYSAVMVVKGRVSAQPQRGSRLPVTPNNL